MIENTKLYEVRLAAKKLGGGLEVKESAAYALARLTLEERNVALREGYLLKEHNDPNS